MQPTSDTNLADCTVWFPLALGVRFSSAPIIETPLDYLAGRSQDADSLNGGGRLQPGCLFYAKTIL